MKGIWDEAKQQCSYFDLALGFSASFPTPCESAKGDPYSFGEEHTRPHDEMSQGWFSSREGDGNPGDDQRGSLGTRSVLSQGRDNPALVDVPRIMCHFRGTETWIVAFRERREPLATASAVRKIHEVRNTGSVATSVWLPGYIQAQKQTGGISQLLQASMKISQCTTLIFSMLHSY